MSYYTILTHQGAAAIANAQATGATVPFTHIALGDGAGAPVAPAQGATALVRQVARVPVSSVTQHAENPSWIIVEAVVPATIGGWTVREIGLLGGVGPGSPRLLAHGSFPETYKPVLETENASRDLNIRMVVEVSSAAAVTLTVDPSVAVATNQSIANALSAHRAQADPHPQYATGEQLVGHLAHADPHPQYLTEPEGDERYVRAGQLSTADALAALRGARALRYFHASGM
ncbi:phage tail protein [Melaminivora sp.]|uniref:phage tail protein n=1 Tax=Melaminivora sp. TaxID=1933032 RepID=UPI0028B1BC58|nr:phage tail protein [Melaminivora sp.]